MALREEDPGLYERLNMLMEGDTTDLKLNSNFSKFVSDADEIIKIIENPKSLNANSITKEDIVHCTGVERTNACDLSSTGCLAGAALYPTYALLNNHCDSNTR